MADILGVFVGVCHRPRRLFLRLLFSSLLFSSLFLLCARARARMKNNKEFTKTKISFLFFSLSYLGCYNISKYFILNPNGKFPNFETETSQLFQRKNIQSKTLNGSLAEWSKAKDSGSFPKGRGFKSLNCQLFFFCSLSLPPAFSRMFDFVWNFSLIFFDMFSR